MDPTELEQRVGRHLRRLPTPSAPGSLLPRVLVAARMLANRPWYRRAWGTWPGAWQAMSATAMLAVAVAVGLAMPTVQAFVSGVVSAMVEPAAARLASETQGLRAGIGAIDVLWRVLVQPLAGYLLVLLVLMWAACATFGVVLTRVAFGEATQS